MAPGLRQVRQKLTRLGQFLFLARVSGGVQVPMRAARLHVLPETKEFVLAGGELRAARTTYRTFEGPGLINYRGLPFLRSLVDAGRRVVVQEGEFVVDVDGGLRMRVPLVLAEAGLAMVDERFVRKEFEGWDVRDAVVIDIGANIGDTALYFIAHGAYRVVAYEPFGPTADVAARNIAVNKVEDRVELHREGIGGSAATRRAAYDPLLPHLASSTSQPAGGASVELKLTTLAAVVARAREIAADRRIVLKVDCEGCEGEVFAGEVNVLEHIASALVETHSDDLKRQVVACLEPAGFTCDVKSEDARLNTALLIATRRD